MAKHKLKRRRKEDQEKVTVAAGDDDDLEMDRAPAQNVHMDARIQLPVAKAARKGKVSMVRTGLFRE